MFRRAIALLTFAALAACSAPQPPTPRPTPSQAPIPPAPQPSRTPEVQGTPVPMPTRTPRPTATPDPRPVIQSPRWFDEAVIYEIFPRSYHDSNGDGIGDLRGIEQKLDYIQSLGVNTLWLTPHYPSTTYHGYDVVDYFAVNPQFGTLDDFKSLAVALKKRNMRLIVDYVANHASNGHPFFKDAYKNPASKYSRWFEFNDARNETYSSFFGVANLPDWNTNNPEVRKYLVDAALFWLDAGADGLRCDYALGVEAPFWQELRRTVKAKHPDAVILGEVWDGSVLKLRDYFGYGFDALFDFPWYLTHRGGADKLNDGVLNGRQPGNLLYAPHRVTQRLYPRGAQVVRFASNHDTNRIASSAGGDARRMRLAAASVLLMPGTPMIYYGEEIGMRGVKGLGPVYDEYRREPMDWLAAEAGTGMTTWFRPDDRANKAGDGVSVQEQDGDPNSLLNFHRKLAALRAANPSLRGTQFEMVEQQNCDACLTLWRWDDARREAALLAFNFSGERRVFMLPIDRPLDAFGEFDVLHGAPRNGKAAIELEPWSWWLAVSR